MAERRMFSNRIANSAKFLQMPADTQLLYFHLILRADDDGVVESYPIMKLLGIGTDNFKLLLAKGYIKQINEDQVVIIIDWLEHNSLRADRKVDSIYRDLIPEGTKILTAKPRSDVKNNSKRIGGQSTDGLVEYSIGKDRLEEYRVEEIGQSPEVTPKLKKFIKPSLEDIEAYCNERSNSVDAQKWFNYYESNGWKVGRNSMKDWKACIRTWETNEKSNLKQNNYQGYASGVTIIPD